ncbi:MAG: hypothetical protein HUK03_03950 [Bacteroidaceae bacterium]|nr:hypothetical protein [Bacteroidaceae bacterium]
MKKEYIKPVLETTEVKLDEMLLVVASLPKNDDEVNGEDALIKKHSGWSIFD